MNKLYDFIKVKSYFLNVLRINLGVSILTHKPKFNVKSILILNCLFDLVKTTILYYIILYCCIVNIFVLL